MISNNQINPWSEIKFLSKLTSLCTILIKGNPMYKSLEQETCRARVVKMLPQVEYLDGKIVSKYDREAAEHVDKSVYEKKL